jgi:tetratricopeptide (TPR) repeat protein
MLASARFLSRDYASAEQPLLALFGSRQSSDDQRAAAAYALCGVYQKTKNTVEQIHFALWLHTLVRKNEMGLSSQSGVADKTVYWAVSGWDLGLLLDAEAPIDKLEAFLAKYPDVPDVRIVKYALAVLLARQNRYEEAAQIYEAIHAYRRAPRMRRLAALYQQSNQSDVASSRVLEAKYKLAELIGSNPNGVYFNDTLWHGLQRYALFAANESRLTREERQILLANERRLKDEQEERWRAYLILRDVVQDSGKSELGRRAAKLAIRYLRGFGDRFGRENDIRKADIDLSNWLRQ